MARILDAAINGARMPSEHPRLPIHADQIAESAAGAVEAGAGAVHFHFDETGAAELAMALLGLGVAVEAGLATAGAAERLIETHLAVRPLRVLVDGGVVRAIP